MILGAAGTIFFLVWQSTEMLLNIINLVICLCKDSLENWCYYSDCACHYGHAR